MEFQNPLMVARPHLGFTGKLVFVTTIQKMMARRTNDQMCFIWQPTFRKTELATSFVSRMIWTLEKEGKKNISLFGHLNSIQNSETSINFVYASRLSFKLLYYFCCTYVSFHAGLFGVAFINKVCMVYE